MIDSTVPSKAVLILKNTEHNWGFIATNVCKDFPCLCETPQSARSRSNHMLIIHSHGPWIQILISLRAISKTSVNIIINIKTDFYVSHFQQLKPTFVSHYHRQMAQITVTLFCCVTPMGDIFLESIELKTELSLNWTVVPSHRSSD